jgi:LysR family glycine cleavage system transcriptional activator
MSYQMPPLVWLRAFEASARLGNFTNAARELLLTPAAVSYQVRALEQHLGYPLFERTHRTLTLTRLGHTYLPSVSKAFTDLSISTMSVFGTRDRRPVRFRCATSFAHLIMLPRWKAFRERHPDIDLQMITAPWSEELDTETRGLDLRFGDGRWQDGTVEFLYNDPIIPVCHPDLALQNIDNPLKQIADAPRLDIMGVIDTWENFLNQHDINCGPRDLGLQVDQSISALELAAQGLGHCLVLKSFAQSYLDSGRLVQSCSISMNSQNSYYIVYSGLRNNLPTEAQVFCDWLGDELGNIVENGQH